MARPSNTAQRRLEIVQALLRVMSISGYESASIQAIAKEAGLRSGLIHYHFKTKQEILVELIAWLGDKAQQRYIRLLKKARGPTEQIEAFIDSALALGEGSDEAAVAAWVVIGAEAIRQPEVQEAYQCIVLRNKNELTKLFNRYGKENAIELTQPLIENITAMTISSIVGAYQLSVTVKEDMPRNYAAQTLKSMVFSLLANSAS